MQVVPGHCLAQAAREFLALYPSANILVADETNFTKDKRARFLSRAATATWDAIIITHSAFKFIGVPSAFEQGMIHDELELYEELLSRVARARSLSSVPPEPLETRLSISCSAARPAISMVRMFSYQSRVSVAQTWKPTRLCVASSDNAVSDI